MQDSLELCFLGVNHSMGLPYLNQRPSTGMLHCPALGPPTPDPRHQHLLQVQAPTLQRHIFARFLASNTNDCHGQPVNLEMSCAGVLTMNKPCVCRRREDIPDHAAGLSCGLETGQHSPQGEINPVLLTNAVSLRSFVIFHHLC